MYVFFSAIALVTTGVKRARTHIAFDTISRYPEIKKGEIVRRVSCRSTEVIKQSLNEHQKIIGGVCLWFVLKICQHICQQLLPTGFSSFRFTQIPLLLALPIALSHFTRDIIFMKSILTSHFRRSHCYRGLLTVCISKTRAASIPYENMFSCLIYADIDTKLLGINHTNASWNILLSPV